ncbi:MAG: Bcr/CflA family drug resistance efflux transporter [Deltaproteobacteria bacterium HGW-Deltaproteobacteria-24]|nr:MAG: Bcr/CflA family drug resistance efflux transporter [Deltaproteobacteria bacterium HGW-Deltaproteobacteria-24]
MKKPINHIYLIILLAILSAVAPVAVDTYIPSIPSMANDFHVGIEQIELTLAIFLIGFAIGQIFGGVLSDRFGRKKSSLIGLLGFAFFSFIIIFSTHIYELWLYRFIEAFFGGLIVVNASAAVRDLFHGTQAAKVFSLIGTVRSLAPLLAPAVGALIIHFFQWEAIFIFLTLYALNVAFFVYKDFEETYTYTKTNALESYKIVFRNTQAMKIMLVLALGFSGMFIFIAKSSYIYIEYFGISTDAFPFYFGISILTLMLLIRVNIKLLEKYKSIILIRFAIAFQMVTALVFIFISNEINLYAIIALTAIYIGMNAFIYGNCTALALESFSKNAGVASSVIGVIQFGVGALITSVVLLFHTDNLTPVAVSIFLISSSSFVILRSYTKI